MKIAYETALAINNVPPRAQNYGRIFLDDLFATSGIKTILASKTVSRALASKSYAKTRLNNTGYYVFDKRGLSPLWLSHKPVLQDKYYPTISDIERQKAANALTLPTTLQYQQLLRLSGLK